MAKLPTEFKGTVSFEKFAQRYINVLFGYEQWHEFSNTRCLSHEDRDDMVDAFTSAMHSGQVAKAMRECRKMIVHQPRMTWRGIGCIVFDEADQWHEFDNGVPWSPGFYDLYINGAI